MCFILLTFHWVSLFQNPWFEMHLLLSLGSRGRNGLKVYPLWANTHTCQVFNTWVTHCYPFTSLCCLHGWEAGTVSLGYCLVQNITLNLLYSQIFSLSLSLTILLAPILRLVYDINRELVGGHRVNLVDQVSSSIHCTVLRREECLIFDEWKAKQNFSCYPWLWPRQPSYLR